MKGTSECMLAIVGRAGEEGGGGSLPPDGGTPQEVAGAHCTHSSGVEPATFGVLVAQHLAPQARSGAMRCACAGNGNSAWLLGGGQAEELLRWADVQRRAARGRGGSQSRQSRRARQARWASWSRRSRRRWPPAIREAGGWRHGSTTKFALCHTFSSQRRAQEVERVACAAGARNAPGLASPPPV